MESLLQEKNNIQKILQVYFIADYQQQTQTRMGIIQNLEQALIVELKNLFHQINPHVWELKTAFKFIISSNENETSV